MSKDIKKKLIEAIKTDIEAKSRAHRRRSVQDFTDGHSDSGKKFFHYATGLDEAIKLMDKHK